VPVVSIQEAEALRTISLLTQATVAEPIVLPAVYVDPSTGTSVIGEVALSTIVEVASVVDGLVCYKPT
jgi:hypothetical protein